MTAEELTADMAQTPRKEVSELELPKGFRFHPTDEELVMHYLCPKAESQTFSIQIIADVDIYKFDPWNLPERAVHGENEWYFFSPRDRKYPNGSRPNRSAGSGYWKATGTDKHISCPIDAGAGSHQKMKKVGIKKALVFYKGRAPNGTKTNWIMHEYRLADSARTASAKAFGSHARRVHRKGSLRLDDWVLCRIYKKKSTTVSPTGDGKEGESIDEREDCIPEENMEDSSSIVEDFLASLPEVESSKLNQLHLLPKLEESSLSLLIGYDIYMQSMESVVIDRSPTDDLDY